MKINYKKTLKFVTLIITSMLIATVSAATYRYMYIDGSINVGTAKMIWLVGPTAPAGTTVSGSTAIVALPVEQGTPINFTECLFLKNDNLTGSFSLTVNVTTTVLGSDFTKAKMHIYENSSGSWSFVKTLDLTSLGDSYSGSLTAQNYLSMTFDVEATTSASGNKAFDIQVSYN